MLKALPSFGAFSSNFVGGQALKRGEWLAIHEPPSLRWRVESVIRYSDKTIRVAFYAYERTGLVEGVASYEELAPPSEGLTPEEQLRQFLERESASPSKLVRWNGIGMTAAGALQDLGITEELLLEYAGS